MNYNSSFKIFKRIYSDLPADNLCSNSESEQKFELLSTKIIIKTCLFIFLTIFLIITNGGLVLADKTDNGLRYGYFTSPDNMKIRFGEAEPSDHNRNQAIMLLNGRAEFMEKYKEVVKELLARGFTVFSLDWRGQGLSGRELENKDKGYVRNYNDYLNDLNIFYKQIVLPAGLPVIILAHSMGGNIALRFLHSKHEAIKKTVLVSPMVDIVTSPIPHFISVIIADIACATGFSESYIPGGGNYKAGKIKFKNNDLTHDPERFMIQDKEIKKKPALAIGDVTWAWLKASFDSIKILENKKYVSEITTPVLIISAGKDSVVSISAQQKICRYMPHCNFISIPGAFHEIMHETDSVRKIFWDNFDEFTNRNQL